MLNETTALAWCDRFAKPLLHWSSGVVAAVVTLEDEVLASYGRISKSADRPPDQRTLFEIGSITKVFTSVLLARLVLQGRLDLDAPIGAIRPEFEGAPEWITPRALATHSSGLPRLHVPIWRSVFMDLENPYAAFSGDDLVKWMAKYRPARRPKGDSVGYSNLAVGLLGYILGLVAGSDYPTALRESVIEPLGLKDTTIHFVDDQRQRFATPHYGRGKETAPWDFDALAGAGALRSSASDLARVARAVIAAPNGVGPLHAELAMTLQAQIHGRKPGHPDQCLGWTSFPTNDGRHTVYAHDGGTRGSLAALLVVPRAEVAVLVLSNHGLNLRKMLRTARADATGIISEIVAARASSRDLVG